MKVRVIEPHKWQKLEVAGFPPMYPYVRPEDIEVVVVEDGDKVIACMTVLRATHFEGAWIDPAHCNAGVVRALIRGASEAARQWTDQWVFAGSADRKMDDVLAKLGGVKLPMDSYVLSLGGWECRKQPS